MSDTFKKFTLDNGVRILCEPLEHVQSVSIGIWCETGSKDETASEGGISHLIEHMLFKGTPSRSAEQIAQSIEGRGGYLNAFTSREETCYYARVLNDDVDNAVEVLGDMYVNSLFDSKELALEKNVVQEEIRKEFDSPEELVHDLYHQNRWGNHPLGLPIIGTHESVGSFSRQDLTDYVGRRYTAGNTLVAASGKLDTDALCSSVEKALGGLEGGKASPEELPPTDHPGEFLRKQGAEQVHFCIGGSGIAKRDDRRHSAWVFDAVMGGSMSSRLHQEIREKRGLAYAVGSYLASYSEGGTYVIYGGTSPSKFSEVRELVGVEFARIQQDLVPDEELARAKRMLKGGMVMGLEATSTRMRRMASNEIIFGRQVPIEEVIACIDAVTSEEIRSLACDLVEPSKINTTAVGSFA
ncbi:MAG: insulinase family protein [Armatimonadota bacterium]|nr:insulinase family protein [Armatimonadota bacterium]